MRKLEIEMTARKIRLMAAVGLAVPAIIMDSTKRRLSADEVSVRHCDNGRRRRW
jgi:hypothetical protein